MTSRLPKLVVVVGETASGKSALAMGIAQKFDGEIINADSRQIYKGLDIVTAKPTLPERRQVPHHLFDLVNPSQSFTAADYKKLAQTAIRKIASRGKLPIMVGGTGLYIDGVLFDFDFLPPGNPRQRVQLSQKSIPELLAILKTRQIDLAGVDVKNKRRLIRLLETGGVAPKRSGLRPETLVIGLRLPRAELRERIHSRIEDMLKAGLLDEVRMAGERYGWDCEALTGIGYRAFKDVILGKKKVSKAKADFLAGDLYLAKRQRTWFKRHPFILWFEDPKAAIKVVAEFVE